MTRDNSRYVATRIDPALPPPERVAEAFARIERADRPEVWITLRDEAEVKADAVAVEARLAAGEDLPLAGLLVAVKDNVDTAGLPTTAGCPEYAYHPDASAPAVERLVGAGAIVLGKTNLDQFATGLVGTRSPYGAVRCAWDAERVSGGSSAGSAVAVGLGLVDVAVGTDTAGSGRVPAAFQGIVGVKPTLGLVPNTGVVPACADYDSVSVFAADVATARRALAVMVGPDDADPRTRPWPPDVRLGVPDPPRLAVPGPRDLAPLSPGYRAAFDRCVRRLRGLGWEVDVVDVGPLLEAAELLYDGAIVAERHAAVGEFLAGAPAGADPVVSGIILGAGALSASAFADDLGRVASARAYATRLLAGYAGLVLPTTTEHPQLADVAADPLGVNRRLGVYTNFCNLLDLAAVAVPAGAADGGPFGVMFVVPAFADQVALDLAARLLGEEPGAAVPATGVELAVFGAHLRGQPLNGELRRLGARFVRPVDTSAAYRLVALDTEPPKPGLVRVGPDSGAAIAGESWLLSEAGLGRLLADLPAPMSLTRVELDDGRWVVGFGCSAEAAAAGTDVTEYGGWAAYRHAGAAEADG